MKYRHRVNVMRPTKALDNRGQLQGNESSVIPLWPCKIEPLTGRKLEQERQTVPTATHRVTGCGNPKNPIADRDQLTGGDLGTRRLTIEHKADDSLHDLGEIVLTCSEVSLG